MCTATAVHSSLHAAAARRIMVAPDRKPPMTALSRTLLRLRRLFLRCYEIAMFALLLGVAVAAAWPATGSGAARQGAAQWCGNIQSSALVMTR